ncbi:UDP-N-acetylglucosamine--LPS N-acetylglucosamine transferase [Actibacterium lipolyticum]|uniref:Oligosaccharide biosynthesis protein Alg14 like protein n=1 Tax=Actibacterium lipolyticum TaxID=1524263 RepID=A0A238KW65_9RHOB|nr:UDP-N-acetylglucosamine--LPS N-acetylglucosamine transferase [Actibacterium lipolyticum]SMX46432.1 Oligosaccharide biosynthesis protein Alg14 like protein [Actibacterium lipolyticum]
MTQKRILAIASGGGHWQQLMLMREAFEHQDVLYLTTLSGLPEQYDATPAKLVPDCNRNQKIATIKCAFIMLWRVLVFRPQMVISTGALPGVLALAFGKMVGAKTVWVDSVANAEEMSMSGMLARRFADLWMSQWEDVAKDAGAEFAGAVL